MRLLAEGPARGVPAPDTAEGVRRALVTRRLRAAVLESNADVLGSLSENLRRDDGLEASAVDLDTFSHAGQHGPAERLPPAILDAGVLVTTTWHVTRGRRLAARVGVPDTAATMCADLYTGVTRLLVAGPVYFVVSDPRCASRLHRTFLVARSAVNLRTLVLGWDELDQVPADTPVYVTRVTRERLAGHPLVARSMAEGPMLSPASTRELLAFVVGASLASLGEYGPQLVR